MARRVIPPFPAITEPGDLIYGREVDGNPDILPADPNIGRVLTISATGRLSWEPGGGGGSGHDPVTVSDTTSIDLTIVGQALSAAAIFGSLAGTVAEGDHNHDADYSDISHTHAAYALVTQLHDPVTVTDSTSINLTLTGQDITAAAIFGTSAGTVAEGSHTHANDHVPVTVTDSASIDFTLAGQNITAVAIFGTTATTIAAGNHVHTNDHVAATVADTASIDMSISGQQISAAAIFGTTSTTVAAGDHVHSNDSTLYECTEDYEGGTVNAYKFGGPNGVTSSVNEAMHPGIATVATSGTNNNMRLLNIGQGTANLPLTYDGAIEAEFIFRMNTTTSVEIAMGFTTDLTETNVGDFVGVNTNSMAFHIDTTSSPLWVLRKNTAAGGVVAITTALSTSTVGANWYRAYFSKTVANVWSVRLESAVGTAYVNTNVATPPLGGSGSTMAPFFAIQTRSSAAKSADIDYVKIRVTGMDRY
jgi:hypothetical protein